MADLRWRRTKLLWEPMPRQGMVHNDQYNYDDPTSIWKPLAGTRVFTTHQGSPFQYGRIENRAVVQGPDYDLTRLPAGANIPYVRVPIAGTNLVAVAQDIVTEGYPKGRPHLLTFHVEPDLTWHEVSRITMPFNADSYYRYGWQAYARTVHWEVGADGTVLTNHYINWPGRNGDLNEVHPDHVNGLMYRTKIEPDGHMEPFELVGEVDMLHFYFQHAGGLSMHPTRPINLLIHFDHPETWPPYALMPSYGRFIDMNNPTQAWGELGLYPIPGTGYFFNARNLQHPTDVNANYPLGPNDVCYWSGKAEALFADGRVAGEYDQYDLLIEDTTKFYWLQCIVDPNNKTFTPHKAILVNPNGGRAARGASGASLTVLPDGTTAVVEAINMWSTNQIDESGQEPFIRITYDLFGHLRTTPLTLDIPYTELGNFTWPAPPEPPPPPDTFVDWSLYGPNSGGLDNGDFVVAGAPYSLYIHINTYAAADITGQQIGSRRRFKS